MVSHERTSKETCNVKDLIKRMEIHLRPHHSNGENPIGILEVLARLAPEANIQEMSKAQAFVMLPSFVEGFALSQ